MITFIVFKSSKTCMDCSEINRQMIFKQGFHVAMLTLEDAHASEFKMANISLLTRITASKIKKTKTKKVLIIFAFFFFFANVVLTLKFQKCETYLV